MNNIDLQYQKLLQDILDNGVEKKDRTGTGTISVFGRQIRHKMSEGFPLLTTKKMAWKSIVTELLWFLNGNTNIKYLVDNGCNIWNGDAYKKYRTTPIDDIKIEHKFKLPNFVGGEILYKPNDYVHYTEQEFIEKIETDIEFAKEWGELGPVYGKQWRSWGNSINRWSEKDQIQNLINDLKTNPDSRRLMVNAWNVADLPVTDYRTDDELYQDYLKDIE